MSRVILLVIGAFATLMGLVWIGQGSGTFPYPAVSPMINQTQWIWWGALLAAVGLIVIGASRRSLIPAVANVLRHPRLQTSLARLVGLYLSLALRTVRWRFVGEEHLAGPPTRGAVIFSTWHEDLPMMPALWARLRRLPGGDTRHIALLVSKSRDGRMIALIMRRFGARTTAGSSSSGGRAALRSLLETLRDGNHIGITPDGPRGPRRHASAGVAQLAALSGAAVMPCAAHVSRGWTMGSWDRMQLPMPFGRGVIVCGAPIFVARDGWREATAQLAGALTSAADRAVELLRTQG